MFEKQCPTWLLVSVVALFGRCIWCAQLPVDVQSSAVVAENSLVPPLLQLGVNSLEETWEFGLSTVVTTHYVRLTPSAPSREGYMWNLVPCELEGWRIDVGIDIHGGGAVGADGFAIWYVDHISRGGSFFGSAATGFAGLGIIADSFDNDGARDNPAIHVIHSDGTKEDRYKGFDKDSDLRTDRVAGCTFDFRNRADDKNFQVAKLRVEYRPQGRLTVHVSSGKRQLLCAHVHVTLPRGFFFGLTANTGRLFDNHDIHYFVVSGIAQNSTAARVT